MRKDRLKPYVHRIKGAQNYALFDILNGNFYHLQPQGNVAELRKDLLEAGLIFETAGIVPFKIEYDLHEELNNINIRELQLRLNGRGEDNCWRRIKKENKNSVMNLKILNHIIKEFENIPVKKIRIEAEELDMEKIQIFIDETNSDYIELYIERGIDRENLRNLQLACKSKKKKFINQKDGKQKIDELQVDPYNFFYNHKFNPCLGHKIAVDICGEIRPCLWSNEGFGNILDKNIKRMINSGIFDKYWELNKDKIAVCKYCELRYNCLDCRVSDTKNFDCNIDKPEFCEYDPFSERSLLKNIEKDKI